MPEQDREKEAKPYTLWRADGSWISREAVETKDNPKEDYVVSEKGVDYEQLAQREREIRKGAFINNWLNEKRSQLGQAKFDKKFEQLKKEALEEYERQQADIKAVRKKDDEERKKQLEKRAKEWEIKRQWESPNPQFLEKQLLVSRVEREKTLRYYLIDVHAGLRKTFILEFYKWILKRLDKLEGRKLKE